MWCFNCLVDFEVFITAIDTTLKWSQIQVCIHMRCEGRLFTESLSTFGPRTDIPLQVSHSVLSQSIFGDKTLVTALEITLKISFADVVELMISYDCPSSSSELTSGPITGKRLRK